MNSGPNEKADPPLHTRSLPLLLLLFVGSGCSALIYEIVWFQLLQLVIGSSAVSLGVLLGTFMGGMCLGSLLLPRVIPARWHPLRVYALLELGIGLIGIALLFGMPAAGRLYVGAVGSGQAGIVWRGVVCGCCLLPPTVLMGATLPAIARWMETTPRGVSRLGFFYGANIAGAVVGCLLAGFYLLRVYDMATATHVAAAINAAVAIIGLVVARFQPYRESASDASERAVVRAPGRWAAYVTIAVSGMCALGAEVIWTRQLSLMLGASVYTFSIILAVFLVGLGIGSSAGALAARRKIDPRLALGCCQLLLTAAVAWTAYMLARSLPFWPIDPSLATSPWHTFQLDLLRCAWAVMPAACLWGASFPLALAAAAAPGQDPARLVGEVYAANTLGAIVGAIGFSMFMIAWIGTQAAQKVLIVEAAGAALLMFSMATWQGNSRSAAWRVARWAPLTVVVLLGAGLAFTVPEVPRGLIAYGRYLPTRNKLPEFLYVGEGMNASIAVSQYPGGVRSFHVSGKVVASSKSEDMRLQKMLGHLPALIHEEPRSVLVVGCGAGVTAGSFVWHPSIERIVICEIEPLIPSAAGEYFGYENNFVIDDPRVEVIIDDARHFLVTTNEKFDIITSDPIHPWVKGAAALYSREYFELCREHLNPGGVVTQWVPLYETSLAAVKSETATFFEVFSGGTIWGNDVGGEGYDIVLLGQAGPTRIDVDQLQARLDREDHELVRQSLDDVSLGSALSLLATYAGCKADLQPWLSDAEINLDGNLRLQYLAGMELNCYDEKLIYDEMLLYRRYPPDLFLSDGMRGETLWLLIESPPSSMAPLLGL